MTFRHIKPEESVDLRSLEKISIDKGIIAPSLPFSRMAKVQKSTDLSPSTNLTENILKLCSGLRDLGVHKYAQEIEDKFLIYKQAETALAGEKAINFAHPKGSHQLEGLSGDSVIETIIDQHLEIVNKVYKQPTGKLTSANEIINAVKVVLADVPNPNLINQMSVYMDQAADTLQNIVNSAKLGMLDNWRINGNIQRIRELAFNPSLDNIDKALFAGKWIHGTLKNILNEENPDLWNTIEPKFGSVWSTFQTVKQIRNSMDNPSSVEKKEEVKESPSQVSSKPQTDGDGFNKWLSNANAILKQFQLKINTDPNLTDEEKRSALGWIAKKSSQIAMINNQYSALNDEEKKFNTATLFSNLRKITTPSFGAFKKEWID